MPNITTVQDRKRGCGWRQAGGMYLMSDGLGGSCGKLPLPLECCPVCNGGIKFGRALTFINPARLFENVECRDLFEDGDPCRTCVLGKNRIPERGWLIGVGEKHYSMGSFIREALQLGVSKRIPQIPRELRLGEDYVFLSYKKAITRYLSTPQVVEASDDLDEDDMPPLVEAGPATFNTLQPVQVPGVFAVFRPSRIEYVVRGDEDSDMLDRLEKRGIRLVKVERLEDTQLEMETK